MSNYKIKKGDTLSGIARANNTTVAELQKINNISDPNKINENDILIIKRPNVPSKAKKASDAGQKNAVDARDAKPDQVIAVCPAKKKKDLVLRAGGDDNVDVLFFIADGDAQSAGVLGHAKGEVSTGLINMKHQGHFGDNKYFGGSHTLTVMSAEAKAQGGIVHGIGGKAEAKAVEVEQGATVFVGTDENNPWAEAGGQYSLMQAEAKGDALIGSDGKRAGVALGGKAGAAAASGDLAGEVNIPIPFTDWTIGVKAKGGGSAGSVGAGAQAHAFKDLETERYHAGIGGELAAFVGLKADLDLSVGPKYTDRERQHGP